MYEEALKIAEAIAELGKKGNRTIKKIRVTPIFFRWLVEHCDKGTILNSLERKSLFTFRGVPMDIDSTILTGFYEIDFEN